MARDIPGALGGSRLLEQPHLREEVERLLGFIDSLRGGAPVLVEVGFDHGRRLTSTAALNPDWRVVGLDVRRKRVDEIQARAAAEGLDNLLVWRVDARIVFANVLPEASLSVVEVLFPTPWWNAAHRHKRLLLTPAFLADCARVLRPGGLLHLATDVSRYADEIREGLSLEPALRVLPDQEGAARRPPTNQRSRREWKCEREGIAVHRFWLERGLHGSAVT